MSLTAKQLIVLSLALPPIIFLSDGCSSPPPLLEWQHSGGPTAQNISAVLPDRGTPTRLLAGLSNGEIWASSDDGRTWSPLSVLVARPVIHALFQHPDVPRRLYAGTSAGLFVSTDAGEHWTELQLDPTLRSSPPGRALAFDPFDPRTMYAGVDGHGLYKSVDGGTSWTRSFPGRGDSAAGEVFDIAISRANPNLIFAALSGAGVVTSSDRGARWTRLTGHLTASGTVPVRLLLHPERERSLCFGTQAGDVYRTTNSGESWNTIRQGNGVVPLGSLLSDPGRPDLIYAAIESGIITSADFGGTWRELPPGFPVVPCRAVIATTGGRTTLYAFGEGAGLRRTTDGGTTWQQADRGLGGSSVSLVAIHPRLSTLFAAAGSAVFLFKPASGTWVTASDGLYGGAISSLTFDAADDSLLYVGTPAGIFRSKNGGRSWSRMPGTFGPHSAEYVDAHLFFSTRLFVVTPAGMFASTDRGVSWKPTDPPGERYVVRTFTYAPGNAGIIHAATGNRGVVGTMDGGLSWESNRYGIKDDDVIAVTRDAQDVRVMYCWTSSGDGYRSSTNGMVWERYVPPWNPGEEVVIAADRASPHLAAALVNRTRVYVTSNAGATWRSVETARLDAEILGLYWSPSQATLFAGTRDRGVYRLDLASALGPAPGNP